MPDPTPIKALDWHGFLRILAAHSPSKPLSANTINADDTTSNVHFNSIVQFNATLESYNQSGLRYAYKYYPSDDHG